MDVIDLANSHSEMFREIALGEHYLRRRGKGCVPAIGGGICIDCGEEIPAARLAANPAAVRCLVCQEKAERR